MLRKLKILFFAVVAFLFVVFAVSNRQLITVSLFPFPYTAELPQFLFAIICFSSGVLVCGVSQHFRMSVSRRTFAREHKRLAALENELAGIKTEQSGIPAVRL